MASRLIAFSKRFCSIWETSAKDRSSTNLYWGIATLERLTLRKVSGVCAILTVVLGIVAFALFALTGISESADAAEVLPQINDKKALVATSTWLFTLAPILLLGTVPGLFQALRQAGDVMWFAVLASIIGGLLIIPSTFFELVVIYEVVTPYVEAGPNAGAGLVVLADGLFALGMLFRLIGDAIFTGIGGLLFSIAILQTGFAPKWVGWVGLIGAVGHWFAPLSQTLEVFELIWFVGEIAFFIWLIAVGVVLLRRPTTPALP